MLVTDAYQRYQAIDSGTEDSAASINLHANEDLVTVFDDMTELYIWGMLQRAETQDGRTLETA